MKFTTYLTFVVIIAIASQTESIAQKADGTADPRFTVQTVAGELVRPWGMTWLPDGRMLVTEKSGDILVIKGDKNTGEKISGLPKISDAGQGGLMDIQLHPDYATNGWIYITWSKPMDDGTTTAVSRFKLEGNTIKEFTDLFVAKPALRATHHYGARIVFDKDKYMFVAIGERGTQPKVQELNNDLGKIHRLYDDGRVPQDNPFVGRNDANPSIWTYGHRNPQGMVYDAATNRIWAAEHGPKGGDELNLIEKGKNYGWPKTCYGINYDGTVLTPHKEMEGVENPARYWVPSIAPCGITIVTSKLYPDWKGNVLVGALAHRHVARVQLDGSKFVGEEKLLQDIGRVRHVAESPDGYLYVLTEGPGQLLKIVPK